MDGWTTCVKTLIASRRDCWSAEWIKDEYSYIDPPGPREKVVISIIRSLVLTLQKQNRFTTVGAWWSINLIYLFKNYYIKYSLITDTS